MNIGVLGTGTVGSTIASRLTTLGHRVMMGSRTANNPKAGRWVAVAGSNAQCGTFAEAAAFGELVFNCTHGGASLEALHAATAEHLEGKVLVDVANILPPLAGTEPLGVQIQQAFPGTRVVKALNTVNCEVMVDPRRVAGTHSVFLSGNDPEAKRSVRTLLESFGWSDIVDLGSIATAAATERYMPLWLALNKTLGTAAFNIAVVR